MKRLSLLGVGLIALLATVPGHAADPAYFSGTIQVGNPSSGILPGIVEAQAPCDPTDPINGLDGVWIDVSPYTGRTAVIGGNPFADFDVRFYSFTDGVCTLIDYNEMAGEFFGEPEAGVVPADAAFALVQLFVGQNASYTLVLS